MKAVIKVFNFMLVTFLAVSCQKNADESRPYEFGFTIDGQQHRHEKKDVNGIIQGEFGFITADGIYHVTVYATDENGNFRILSMKNIRISAPLDGSPLPKGAKIESYPGAGKLNQNQPQTQVQRLTQPQTLIQNPPQIQPIQINQPIQTTSQPIQTTRSKVTYVFTTQPTIKPACGGCGYVTTPKPKPGERFPFQIPAFQKPSPQIFGTGINPNSPNVNPESGNSGSSLPSPGSNYPHAGTPGLNYPQERNPGLNYPQERNPGLNYPQEKNPGSSLPTSGITYPQNENPTPSVSTLPGKKAPFAVDERGKFAGVDFPNSGPSFENPTPNEIDVNRLRRPLSQVTVSDGAIHVPGNPDIPIRDKYAGMVDGLPDGVTEKDIKDLLYKFNYTVGFHGHYEKGLKNGAKIGGYFVTGRDGISRIVTYVADENGFRPKVKFVRLDLNSDEVPKEDSEKKFGLKNFEFVWYPIS